MVANWKMNYGRADEALDFVRRIRHPLNEISGVERVLCPPFTVLTAVADALAGTEIALGAQTMHWDEKGAHTGEVSPAMLADLCRFVILGHSERRGSGSEEESDAAISRKARAALAHALTPIICVGENRAQREAGETISFVGGQVAAALDGLTPDQSKRCAIAYEPIWAIGTGQAATPEEANRVIGLAIRGMISQKLGESAAQSVQVLYGGSVTVENMASFAAMPEIDGALVGGASLRPDFVELVRQAI
jgi:triosephosphate isomerase